MMTNALRVLNTQGISFTALDYPVDEDDLSAMAVAAKTGLEPDRIFKTLAVLGDRTGPFICVIPGSSELDFKKVAKASGNRSVEMYPLRDLESLTGYVRGGCSPVGLRKKLPIFFDETIQIWEEVAVSAGRRGLQMLLAPASLISVTGGTLADLT